MKKALLAVGVFIAGLVLTGSVQATPPPDPSVGTITVVQSAPGDVHLNVAGCGFDPSVDRVIAVYTDDQMSAFIYNWATDSAGCGSEDIAVFGIATGYYNVAIFDHTTQPNPNKPIKFHDLQSNIIEDVLINFESGW